MSDFECLSVQDIDQFNRMPQFVSFDSQKETSMIISCFVLSIKTQDIKTFIPAQREKFEDVTPFMSQLFECMVDKTYCVDKIKKLTHTWYGEINRLQENYLNACVNNIDAFILLETACFNLYDKVEQSRMRISDRYLPYGFRGFTGSGSVILEKYQNLYEFYDFIYGV